MTPRKRNCNITGGRRLTRLQARLNKTPTPEPCPYLPRRSLASPSSSRKNANSSPKAAERIRGRKVNEEQENVMIISDESENDSADSYKRYLSTANELCGEANLSEELVDRSNDRPLQDYSDKDSQSVSETPSDFEAEMATYSRRSANTRSNSRGGLTKNAHTHCLATTSNGNDAFRAGNSSNSRIIDGVGRNLNTPFSEFIGENVSAPNAPENSAGNGVRKMPREEPTTAFAAAVERHPEPTCNLTGTCSFGLTEMIGMSDLESGMEEVQSPPVCTVHGYAVKQKFVSILRRIIDKYGDIAVNYSMESIQSRSFSLETICQIIQTLQEKSFNELSLAEITGLLAQVSDFRKIGMRVVWLEKRLEDMKEAKHAIKNSSSLKEERYKKAEFLRELRTKLEDDRTQLNDCRTQILILNDSINEKKRELEFYEAKTEKLRENEISTMKDLEKAQDEAMMLNQTTLELISKVQNLVAHPLVDDLL